MAYKKYTAGAWRTVKRWQKRQGAAWRTIRRARVWSSGAWREFFVYVNPMTIAFTPSTVDAESSFTFVSGSTVASVTGGTAPFTYVWALVSYTAPTAPIIGNGATSSPTFTQGGLNIGDFYTAVLGLTVTDNLGQVATATINATFERTI